MKKLPIGIQEFRKLREGGYIYVDKTEYIYKLITEGSYYFLSRPRRFGKSLLVNTLAELFSGCKELFKGLWIENKIEWDKHPVIHFDFSRMGYKEVGLEIALGKSLNNNAEQNNVKLTNKGIALRFEELIQKCHEKFGKGAAILIDEYDKPIIDFLDKESIHKAHEHRETLKSFYSILKGNDAHIRFLFMTGVSKFSKVSVFSDLNHLMDITTVDDFAAMLGYTQAELSFFSEYYPDIEEKYKNTYPNIDEAIKKWYDGYSWNGTDYLYNPFSILSFLKNKQFKNYWYATGTPSFLIKLVKERNYSIPELSNIEIQELALDKFNIEKLELIPLLFQTGYLTIKEAYPNQILRLGFPNREVDGAFNTHLLAELLDNDVDNASIGLIKLTRHLKEEKPEDFILLLNTLFKGIAYQNADPTENYFHSLFYLVVKLLGYTIESEIQTIDGRIDAVVWTDQFCYIMEFKIGKAAEAMKQIKTKEYDKKYLGDGKKIYLIGIGFNARKKQIGDWLIEDV